MRYKFIIFSIKRDALSFCRLIKINNVLILGKLIHMNLF